MPRASMAANGQAQSSGSSPMADCIPLECWRNLFGALHPPPKKLHEIIQDRDLKALSKFEEGFDEKNPLVLALRFCVAHGTPHIEYHKPGVTSWPLHEAVEANMCKVLSELLLAKAKIDCKDSNGLTPLDLAKKCKSRDCEFFLHRADSRKSSDEFIKEIKFIAKVPLFNTLHPAEYPRVAKAFTTETYQKGETIVKQGDPGDCMYIIESGRCIIKLNDKDGRPQPLMVDDPLRKGKKVAVYKEGEPKFDFFGDASLLYKKPRNATVEADSATVTVKVLRTADFNKFGLRDKLVGSKRKAVFQADEENAQGDEKSRMKTSVEKDIVRQALKKNNKLGPLVDDLDEKNIEDIVDSAFKITVMPRKEVIKQGDLKADVFYIVQEGELDVVVNGAKVFEYDGSKRQPAAPSFGELALLFRSPRAATVRSTSKCTLWCIPRQELRSVMQAPMKKKLDGYANILDKVEILDDVSPEDKRLLADALIETTLDKGQEVFKQGEEGDIFYIVLEGTASAASDGKVVQTMTGVPDKGHHDFFGEKALLEEKPRAATVTATSDRLVLLALHRNRFNRVKSKKEVEYQTADYVDYSMDTMETLGTLGYGGFGTVTLVKDKTTNTSYALKSLSKGHIVAKNSQAAAFNEKTILRMTRNRFVVQLAATFDTEHSLCFLMEPVMGGELYAVYQRQSFFGDQEKVRFHIGCSLRALVHLHDRSIIYRDLKPENLLINHDGYLKLTDFGLSKFVMGHAYTTCGTPAYFAPEMVAASGHNLAIDWWGLGVLIYELMTGETPFNPEGSLSDIDVFLKINQGIELVKFPTADPWTDLVRRLCQRVPSERLAMRKGGFKNIMEHMWYTDVKFDWAKLEKGTMRAPYVPDVKRQDDLAHFNPRDEDQPKDEPYKDDGSKWEADFEERKGPKQFAFH